MLKSMQSEPCHYIVSGSTQPAEPRTMQYHFAKILKNENLPSVKFHSLRHCMASAAIEAGFDVKTLSEILGHARIELTMNLYVHSNMDMKRRCMDKLKWVFLRQMSVSGQSGRLYKILIFQYIPRNCCKITYFAKENDGEKYDLQG